MILVTGTKRSGTSMWMQILDAAGFDTISEKFSGPWETSIHGANPRGFYESWFRQGVFYGTNPHPKTGEWLHPRRVRDHAVKVFIPGVVRTDFAYIRRVVGTMRHWRTYGDSLGRLYAMEDEFLADKGEEAVAKARANRSKLPADVEWFFEYYDLIRDASTRGYAINLTTYERLLRDPEAVLSEVLPWLGKGDLAAGMEAIDPSLQRTPHGDAEGLEPEEQEVADALHATLDAGEPLSRALVERMNTTWRALSERYGSLSRERAREEGPPGPSRDGPTG